MKKFLALLLSLVMLLSLAACGGNNTGGTTGENTGSGNTSGSNTGDSTDTGDTAGTGEIQPTLTIGIASDINNLDPQDQNDQINNNCIALTHQTLVFLANENNEYLPCLAESWEWTDDTHLVFHLVQNANFSDGTPFNADDVVFTYEKAMDPDRSAVAATLSLVESVEKIDDYTVQFVTSSYSNELLAVLAGYPLVILSKEAYEDPSNEEPYLIGTGRYVFNEWKQSEYVSFVKNENFWGDDPGVAEEIIFQPILEAASRVAALQSGDIDVCIDPPVNMLETLGPMTTSWWRTGTVPACSTWASTARKLPSTMRNCARPCPAPSTSRPSLRSCCRAWASPRRPWSTGACGASMMTWRALSTTWSVLRN